MTTIRKLAGQTAIYGISSIAGRFLNYLLVPFYTRIFSAQEYGVVSELFAYSAFLMVLFTYGMETSFFHFSEKSNNKNQVFSTGVISLILTSVLLAGLMLGFSDSIAGWIQHPRHPEYVRWFALILFFDTAAALPFASLRQQNKAGKFATVKICNILINIFFNIFFLVICPAFAGDRGALGDFILAIYSPSVGVGYVFVSNLIASVITLLLLVPEFRKIRFHFDRFLLKQMLLYGLPLVFAGFAGMINETLDRAVYKYLAPDSNIAMKELGIYSACYKLSIIMTLFIQTFRFAAEPFFFSQQGTENNRELYARVMKYFVIACSVIFIAVILFLNVFKLFIGEKFHSGLAVVPVLLLANMFLGIYYNLSIWYKLTGQTRFGAYFSLTGAVITIVLLFVLIPRMGYMGAAWTTLICYASMMALSYATGQKNYPVPYDLPRIFTYILLALLIYFAHYGLLRLLKPGAWTENIIGALLFLAFIAFIMITEKPRLSKSNAEQYEEK